MKFHKISGAKSMNKIELENFIQDDKLIVIIRAEKVGNIQQIINALIKGGVRVLEVSFNTPGAADFIRTIRSEYDNQILCGAGTILDAVMAERAIDSGAQFVISPVYKHEMIRMCLRHGVPAIPGIFTPSEAMDAYAHGASFLKVFPAGQLGPGFIKAIKNVMPQLPLIPVGGVTAETVEPFLQSGAAALAVGSAIVNSKLVEKESYAEIEKNAAWFREKISACLM